MLPSGFLRMEVNLAGVDVPATVNRLLGYTHRVAMTVRDDHTPTEESNARLYAFSNGFSDTDRGRSRVVCRSAGMGATPIHGDGAERRSSSRPSSRVA